MPDKSTPLTVHEAQVTTATVEIRVLTIGGKQMSLAVFRQLPETPLLYMTYVTDPDHPITRMIGTPWGHVRHHSRECPGTEHLHVVSESAGRLAQTVVRRDGWVWWYQEHLPEDNVTRTRWRHGMHDDWVAHYEALERLPQLFIAV